LGRLPDFGELDGGFLYGGFRRYEGSDEQGSRDGAVFGRWKRFALEKVRGEEV
jgi:hypothetical protein